MIYIDSSSLLKLVISDEHSVAVEELGVGRLMTHDRRQADAARELGYEVVMPGV